MAKIDLVVMGHLLKEYIHFPGKKIGPVLGSPCAYSSVAASKLGVKTAIVTNIGKDMPDNLLTVFNEVGVDTRGIKIGRNTTTNQLIYERSGKKKLEFLKKAPKILFKDIPLDYLNANIFLICPIDYEIPISLVKKLHELNRVLIVDVGGYGGASSTSRSKSIKERLDFLKKIAPYFHFIKMGIEDCQCILGRASIDEEEIAVKFINWGCNVCIITCGGQGALAVTKNDKIRLPAFPAKIIDVTGAGDTFTAGFLSEYCRGNRDTQKDVLFGLATASLVIEKTGGVKSSRMPTKSDVYKRIGKEV